MEYTNSQVRRIIEDFIHSERDRQVLIEKYCNKKTIKQLADMFYLSEKKLIYSKAKLKRLIHKIGLIDLYMEIIYLLYKRY